MAHDNFLGGEDFPRYPEDERIGKREYNKQNP